MHLNITMHNAPHVYVHEKVETQPWHMLMTCWSHATQKMMMIYMGQLKQHVMTKQLAFS